MADGEALARLRAGGPRTQRPGRSESSGLVASLTWIRTARSGESPSVRGSHERASPSHEVDAASASRQQVERRPPGQLRLLSEHVRERELLHGLADEEQVLLLLVQPLLELPLRPAVTRLVRDLNEKVPAGVVDQLGGEERVEQVRELGIGHDDLLDALRLARDEAGASGLGVRISAQGADPILEPLLVLL